MDGFLQIEPVQTIVSPCVNVCEIDRTRGLCCGCRRTLDEIARWTAMTPAQRDTIMAELPGRLV